jgi:hypothetical protein
MASLKCDAEYADVAFYPALGRAGLYLIACHELGPILNVRMEPWPSSAR